MADNLVQVLGFDASSALANIRLVNDALKVLTQNLNTVATAAAGLKGSGVNAALKSMGTSAQGISTQLGAAGNAATAFGAKTAAGVNAATASTSKFAKSLSTISTVLKTQIILQAFNAIRSSLREGVKDAVDFQKAVAEISTITSQSNLSIGDEIQATASTFGFDVLDVAEAKYQLLSNQIKGAETSNEAFTASLKLARATNSDVTASVNLLASVLNSFGKESKDAEEAAGTLFSLVEQGRVRVPELASALGTVTPLANQLGVSFEELAAQLAVITRQGVRASVALTQQRSIFNKLLKPSEALQKVFKDLGVRDAVQGIERFGGLVPFLKAINDEGGQTLQQQAELFNNVRGLAGLLNTFANNGNDVQKVFEEIGTDGVASVDRLNAAFEKVNDTNAVELERQLQSLRVAFINIGQDALPVVISAVQTANSFLTTFVNNWETVASVATLAATSLVALKGVAIAVGAGLTVAAGPLALIAGGAALLGVAITLAAGQSEAAIKKINDQDVSAIIGEVEKLKASLKGIETVTQEIDGSFDDIFSGAKDELKDFVKANKSSFDTINDLAQNFVSKQTATFANVVDVRKSILSQLEKAAKDSEKKITDSQEASADLRTQLANRQFDQQIKGFDDISKASRELQRSQDTFRGAQKLVDTGNLEDANELLEEAGKQAAKALQTAQAGGNQGQIRSAEQQINDVLSGRITIQDAITKKQIEIGKQAAIAAEKEREAVQKIQDLSKEIGENIALSGDIDISQEQRDKAKKKVLDLTKELQDTALSTEAVDLADVLGFSGQALQAQQGLVNFEAQFNVDAASLNAKVATIAAELQVKIPVTFELQQAGLLDLDGFDFAGSVEDAFKKAEEGARATNDAFGELAGQQGRVDAAMQGFRNLFSLFEPGPLANDNVAKSLADAFNRLNEGGLDASEIESFISLLTRARDLGQLEITDGGREEDAARLENITTLLKRLSDEQKKLEVAKVAVEIQPETVANIDKVVQGVREFAGLNASDSGLATEADAAATGTTTMATQLTNGVATSGAIADNLERGARAAAQTASSGGGAQNQMFGGFMKRLAKGGNVRYLNGGGFASRGTDTVPAMLSPGEFVMNARASRKFASQLVAMNSGIRPQFRQDGGSITNNNVDVGSIQVIGSNDPEATARAVQAKLRREFRRGTSRPT